MADDDALRQRQLKELRQLRGQGGDGHHRRAVAEPDGDSGLARGAEPVERPALRFEGKVAFVRDRAEGVLRVARKHRDDLWIPEMGTLRVVRPRTNPATEALLPIPNAIVSSNVSVRPGVPGETPHRISEVTPRRHYAGRDARPVPLVNGRSEPVRGSLRGGLH